MLTQLSLRLRILLFFSFLAAGAIALAAGSLWFGWSRTEGLPTGPFVTALIAFCFLNTGLVLGVWLLFDENVAKPINRLSADMRLRAHSGVEDAPVTDSAIYLGDLAPAVQALTQSLSENVLDTAAMVARETQRLRSESDRLTALLTESPTATILLNPAKEIVLYDGQAAGVLGFIAPPRLKAPLADYFDIDAVSEAIAKLGPDLPEATVTLKNAKSRHRFEARVRALADDGHMIFIDAPEGMATKIEARPLVFDFDLVSSTVGQAIQDTPLADLCFVAFDSETTGLSVAQDDIIQLGAVRLLNGRLVEGEVFDTYVDPGRAIPPASTEIHRIHDADVAGAPDIITACKSFHHFSRDAVLVAHNAPFDIGLLRKYADQCRLEWAHPVLDTVLLSAVVFGTTEEHTLDALCERLGIEIPEAHRHSALGDALATGQALAKLLPLLEGRGLRTFGDVTTQTQKHGRLLQDLNAAN